MEWISVKDRLPPPEEYCLLVGIDGDVRAGFFRTRCPFYDFRGLEPVYSPGFVLDEETGSCEPLDWATHWMPLPKPPNDGKID